MNRLNLNAILKVTGERYIIIVIAVSQALGLLGAVPGIVSARLNTGFDPFTARLLSTTGASFWLASQVIVLFICWWVTPNARNLLSYFAFGIAQPDKEKELSAWREITSLSTQYGAIAFFINSVITVIIPFFITALREEVATAVPVYILLGGLAGVIGSTLLSMFLIGRFTIPARTVLLPKEFETQLQGRAGTLLAPRFQIVSVAIAVMALAVIAPVGHRQITRIAYEGVGALQAIKDLQSQTLFLSVLIVIAGAALSFLSIQSIAGPVKSLSDILQKIRQGDFSQRTPILATDEIATVAIHLNRILARFDELQSSLENQVAERTKQLSATNEVGRVASSILDPDELLRRTANLITEQFNYYYAAIYLLDPSERWVELKEATGQAGEVLKQNRHRLEATGRSIVAACMREKAPLIVQNTAEETQRVDNPLLPYTRSEIALPLIAGSRVLGALDVQSTKPSDFDEDIIETMQNVAAQVAIALENARLFQESQQSINELKAIQKQYLFEGWSDIKSYNENLEYGIGETSGTESQIMENPIILRDQVFGKITIEGHDEWTPEQRSLVDAVATQAAIALENARLVSESRQIALRERTLTEINSKIWSSPTIDSILQNVIKELGRRLDATNATIELNMDDES